MKDRKPRQPGRVKITPEDGSPAYFANMEMADEPIDPGTPLNKSTLLSDEVAASLGLSPDTGTPSEAFKRVMGGLKAGETVTIPAFNIIGMLIPSFHGNLKEIYYDQYHDVMIVWSYNGSTSSSGTLRFEIFSNKFSYCSIFANQNYYFSEHSSSLCYANSFIYTTPGRYHSPGIQVFRESGSYYDDVSLSNGDAYFSCDSVFAGRNGVVYGYDGGYYGNHYPGYDVYEINGVKVTDTWKLSIPSSDHFTFIHYFKPVDLYIIYQSGTSNYEEAIYYSSDMKSWSKATILNNPPYAERYNSFTGYTWEKTPFLECSTRIAFPVYGRKKESDTNYETLAFLVSNDGKTWEYKESDDNYLHDRYNQTDSLLMEDSIITVGKDSAGKTKVIKSEDFVHYTPVFGQANESFNQPFDFIGKSNNHEMFIFANNYRIWQTGELSYQKAYDNSGKESGIFPEISYGKAIPVNGMVKIVTKNTPKMLVLTPDYYSKEKVSTKVILYPTACDYSEAYGTFKNDDEETERRNVAKVFWGKNNVSFRLYSSDPAQYLIIS